MVRSSAARSAADSSAGSATDSSASSAADPSASSAADSSACSASTSAADPSAELAAVPSAQGLPTTGKNIVQGYAHLFKECDLSEAERKRLRDGQEDQEKRANGKPLLSYPPREESKKTAWAQVEMKAKEVFEEKGKEKNEGSKKRKRGQQAEQRAEQRAQL